MNKKQEIEPTIQNKKYHGKVILKIMMVRCRWKKSGSEQNIKMLIARALNRMVELKKEEAKTKKIEILGYLITRRRVFLVLEGKEKSISEKLSDLEDDIREGLGDKKNRFGDLFKIFPLYNENLVRLITGQKPDVLYYSPRLVKFQNTIQNYPFSSAMNYSGAQSMVHVELKSASFWKKKEERK